MGAQRANVTVAVAAFAELASSYDLLVTHGNGPQVGLLALLSAERPSGAPDPLDVIGAESEGMIGYLIEQELRNSLPGRQVAALLTQVVVDVDDPAFVHPSKPIGPMYERRTAFQLAARRGWRVARDGPGYRRVVPSPEPRRIVEMDTITMLLDRNVVVICAGGGGIPVVESEHGLRGAEAVIDKDLCAALLAQQVGAEKLLLLTDVASVQRDWDTDHPTAVHRASPSELSRMIFDPGSMQPKITAACRFVTATGGWAGIGALADATSLLRGETGTVIVPEFSGKQRGGRCQAGRALPGRSSREPAGGGEQATPRGRHIQPAARGERPEPPSAASIRLIRTGQTRRQVSALAHGARWR